MHANYVKEMQDAAMAIIEQNDLSSQWRNRSHIITVAKSSEDPKVLNDIFDTFIREEEVVDIEIYSALRDNPSIDAHLKENIAGCHAKLTRPSLEELDEMEMSS
jgi:hypothetical protein